MKKIYITLVLCLLVFMIQAQNNITVYTQWGQSVQGIIYTEMSTIEINQSNLYWTTVFPLATFLENSSNTYNCHSYAWNMTDGGAICWINAGTNNSNISKYWIND